MTKERRRELTTASVMAIVFGVGTLAFCKLDGGRDRESLLTAAAAFVAAWIIALIVMCIPIQGQKDARKIQTDTPKTQSNICNRAWQFVLDRVAEFSNAVRGKRGPAKNSNDKSHLN